jgi:hypothetical protein
MSFKGLDQFLRTLPILETIETIPCFDSKLMRCEIHKGVPKMTKVVLEVSRQVQKVKALQEAVVGQDVEKLRPGNIRWNVSEHNRCMFLVLT